MPGPGRLPGTICSLVERRRRGSLFAGLLLTVGVGLVLFVFLYMLKTVLGIDVFPDTHLWDLFSG